MAQITLNNDQMQVLQAVNGDTVALVNSQGELIGYLMRPPFSKEEVAAAVERANTGGPWYTTAEVLQHLAALEKECAASR